MQESSGVVQRSEMVDLMRGIAAICLIIDHSIISTPINLGTIGWCKKLGDFISIFDLPLFFLVAGYVFSCRAYKMYFFKKVRRIGLPYLVFAGVSIFFHIFAGALLAGGVAFQQGIVDLLIHGGEYWFLYTIFIIYLIFPIIASICGKNNYFCTAGLCILILGASVDVKTDVFLVNRVLQYLPYFYTGWLLRREMKREYVSKAHLYYWPLGVIAFVALLEVNLSSKTYLKAFLMALSFCYAMVGCLYQVNKMLNSTSAQGSNYVKDFVLCCGQYSLQLYLFNMYLQVLIRIMLCSILGISNAFLIITVGSTLNFIVVLPICCILEKHGSVLKYVCGL